MKYGLIKNKSIVSLLTIGVVITGSIALHTGAFALDRPPEGAREEGENPRYHGRANKVELSRERGDDAHRQSPPQYRQSPPQQSAPQPQPRIEQPRQEVRQPSRDEISRMNQMQFGRNEGRTHQPPKAPIYADNNHGQRNNSWNHEGRNNQDRARSHDYQQRDNRNWDNRNWDNRNYSDGRNQSHYNYDNRQRDNNNWNNNNRSHFEFGNREGRNYWGPNGNNWSRWNNSWGNPNDYARRWGFDGYDHNRGWRRGNVWYAHPSLWSDWGGWYSFFLSDGMWGFSYSNYADPYYRSYGNNCLKMQTSDWDYGRRAIYSFVACLNSWGQYQEVRGTRQFEGWDY